MKYVSIALILLLGAASCRKKPTVKTVQAAATRVESTVSTVSSGTVEAEQDSWLGFSAAGRVKKIFVKEGDRVREGQRLAELDNADLGIIYEDAATELDRSVKLQQEGLVAKSALDQARKAFEIARSNLERSVILAPFAGMVTELTLRIGEQAGAAARQGLRLTDLRGRSVRGHVDELDLAKVKPGQMARVKVLAARPEPFRATVTRIIPYVDTTKEQDRTSELLLRLEETSDPIPVGASADIEIVVQEKTDAPALPARAVLGSGVNRFVFVVDSDRLKKTPVKLGLGNYDRVEISEGVKVGDTIAMPSEDFELKDEQKVQVEKTPWP